MFYPDIIFSSIITKMFPPNIIIIIQYEQQPQTKTIR